MSFYNRNKWRGDNGVVNQRVSIGTRVKYKLIKITTSETKTDNKDPFYMDIHKY